MNPRIRQTNTRLRIAVLCYRILPTPAMRGEAAGGVWAGGGIVQADRGGVERDVVQAFEGADHSERGGVVHGGIEVVLAGEQLRAG